MSLSSILGTSYKQEMKEGNSKFVKRVNFYLQLGKFLFRKFGHEESTMGNQSKLKEERITSEICKNFRFYFLLPY